MSGDRYRTLTFVDVTELFTGSALIVETELPEN